MKRYVLLSIVILIFISIFISFQTFVFADRKPLGSGFEIDNIAQDADNADPLFTKQFNRIWNTFIYVARVAAFIGIFIIGLTYIFANADKKADIKKSLLPMLIGIVIFFGATFVIDFVKRVFFEIV